MSSPIPKTMSHGILKCPEIVNKFQIENILGNGAFATVYTASTKKQYSVKSGQSTVALKLVNVSQIDARKKRKASGNVNEKSNHQDNNLTNRTDIDDEHELDTDELFFPSRCDDNCHDADEGSDPDHPNIDESLDAVNREISVHLAASTYGHPNIVFMLDSFQFHYHAPRATIGRSSADLIVAMVLEKCCLGDLHSYLKRRRDQARRLGFFHENNEHHDNDHDLDQVSTHKHHTDFDVPLTLLEEREARYAMRHVLRGLAFLHSRGIVHRDIKAGNIFLSPGSSNNDKVDHDGTFLSLFDCTLKLGDFGLAAQMSNDDDWDESLHTLCGTPSCIAPEVALSTPISSLTKQKIAKKTQQDKEKFVLTDNDFSKINISSYSTISNSKADSHFEPYHSNNEYVDTILQSSDQTFREMLCKENIRGHGQPADLWSTGCLFYALLVGRYPFSVSKNPAENYPLNKDNDARVRGIISRAIKGEWSIPSYVQMSEPAKSLLDKLLSIEPHKRGFARGILSTHPFFTVNDKPFVNTHSSNASLSSSKENSRVPESQIHHREKIGSAYKNYEGRNKIVPKVDGNLTSTLNSSKQGIKKIGINATPIRVPNESFDPQMISNRSNILNDSTELKGSIKERGIPIYKDTRKKDEKINNSQNCVTSSTENHESSNIHDTTKNNIFKRVLNEYDDTKTFSDVFSQKKANKNDGLKFVPKQSSHALLTILHEISFLPSMKHTWKEIHKKKNKPKEKVKRYYSIFILPYGIGAVIQCKEKNGKGAWIHLTGDGTRVGVGKLSHHYHYHNMNGASGKNQSIIDDAFCYRPKNIDFPPLSNTELSNHSMLHQSLSMADIRNDLTSTPEAPSIYSLPAQGKKSRKSKSYHPLSSLLTPQRRPYLLLYRKLEKFIIHLKKLTPKAIMYVHSCKILNESSSIQGHTLEKKSLSNDLSHLQPECLLCKTLLMQNGPMPNVEVIFTDGVVVRHQTSAKLESVSVQNDDKEITLYRNRGIKEKIKDIEKNTIKPYRGHIKMARIAVKKIINLLQSQELTKSDSLSYKIDKKKHVAKKYDIPFNLNVIVTGRACEDWILFDTSNMKATLESSRNV